MDTVTVAQILLGAVYMSNSADKFGKDRNLAILCPAQGKR